MSNLSFSHAALNTIPLPHPNFTLLRENHKIYVDKTHLIASLANSSMPIFLSRPRRFGKTLLISTFESLFSRGLQDFDGLAIANEWHDKARYPVVTLTFSSYMTASLEIFNDNFCDDMSFKFFKLFPHLKDLDLPKKSTANILLSCFFENIEAANLVLLIDEYDAPIIHTLDSRNLQKNIINYLSTFFNVIKTYLHKFRFVFIAGITKISHTSPFSGAKFINDITLDDQYATLLGLTEKEIYDNYGIYLKNAANILNLSDDELFTQLKYYYDGYQFSVNAQETVYNPWSVLNFLVRPERGFQNYWYESGGRPSLLMNYLQGANQITGSNISKQSNLRDILGSKGNIEIIKINDLKVKTSVDELPISLLLLQTGYFTIRKLNIFEIGLALPNAEVSDALILLSMSVQGLRLSEDTQDKMIGLPRLIDEERFDEISELFSAILIECITPNSNAFKNENALRDIIFMMIPDGLVKKSRENPNAFGFSDLELATRKTKICIEFKRSSKEKSDFQALKAGLEQLASRNYGLGKKDCISLVMVINSDLRKITETKVFDREKDFV